MFKPNVEVTIRREAAEPGGAGEEFTVPALMTEQETRDFGDRPWVHGRRELLIPPPRLPRAGDLALCGGAVWEIKSVRLCRDLSGATVAARCRIDG